MLVQAGVRLLKYKSLLKRNNRMKNLIVLTNLKIKRPENYFVFF